MLSVLKPLVVVLMTLNFICPATAEMTLVENGEARVAVHVPPRVMAPDITVPPPAQTPGPQLRGSAAEDEEMQRRRLRESVKDFAATLQKMTGVEIEIRQQPPDKSGRTVPVLIAEYAMDRFGGMDAETPFRQGWRMTVGVDGIGLQGESDEAASYAIYEVLDRLGCRWFMPGDMGEVIPFNPAPSLPLGDFRGAPGTAYRNVWPAYAGEDFVRRNRLGGFLVRAEHALEHYISEEQLQQNPEWRAIIGGEPHRYRLKWSNPEVAEAVADAIIAKLDLNYRPSVSLSPEDGSAFDETDDRALDAGDWDPAFNQPSITDRYIVLCNRIAERVTKKYPDVTLGFLAYVQYTRPPVREKLHPNLVPQIAPINYCRAHTATDPETCSSRAEIASIVKGWGEASKQVSYYNYMFNLAEVTAPYPMIRQMSEELPMIYDNKVVFWQPETIPNFEQVLPGMWLSLRMAWDPQLDPGKVMDEFYPAFYGSAAEPMRRYWEILDDAWTKPELHAGGLWSYPKRFTPEVLAAARHAIEEAGQSAATPAEYERVTLQERALRQFERFMKMRTDLNEGRLKDLDMQCTAWSGTQLGLAEEYADNYCFAKTYWTRHTIGGEYFRQFAEATYRDAARMAQENIQIGAPLREWKYQLLQDPGVQPGEAESKFDGVAEGEKNGWQHKDFDDTAWKTTDIGLDTWADLQGIDTYGMMWYRNTLKAPALPAGKRVLLWLAGTDGSAKVFVNGQHIPFRDKDGKSLDMAEGYAVPFTFDITEAVKSGEDIQIAIAGTRTFVNELGTGGLLGPAYIFREK